MRLLSEQVPDHPVILHSSTRLRFGETASPLNVPMSAKTPAPAGGEIRGCVGNPTGILLNNAAPARKAVPQPTPEQLANRVARRWARC
jgi:predicted amidohydrolase YtcJ